MARPGGYTNQYPPSSDGFIPNGQPPQFNGRPPVYPEKAPRPMMMGQQLPNITNGNQQFSHPSSLSSQSSRDPSPIPPPTHLGAMNRHTPTATPPQMSPVPPHQQNVATFPNRPVASQNYAASHRPGTSPAPYGQSIPNPSNPGTYRPIAGNGPLRPQMPSRPDQAPGVPPTNDSASSYSATNSPRRFEPSRQPNAGMFAQSSQLGPDAAPAQPPNDRGAIGILGNGPPNALGVAGRPPNVQGPPNVQATLAGAPMPRTNAMGTLPAAGEATPPEPLNRMATYGQQPSPSRQQVNGHANATNGPSFAAGRPAPGFGQQAPFGQQPPSGFGPQAPPSSGPVGPASAPTLRPAMQNSQLGSSQTDLQRIPPLTTGMFQSGSGFPPRPAMAVGGPGINHSGMSHRPGMPPSGPGMQPSHPGMPQSGPAMYPSGPGMPPSGQGMSSGPGVPPSGPGLPPSGLGMPPSGLGMSSGPGMPPSGLGMPPSGSGMPPSGLGMSSGPGMPPSGPGMPPSGPGMPPSGPGMQMSHPGMPPPVGRPLPASGPHMPAQHPGTNGYQQNTVPTSQMAANRYPQQPQQPDSDAGLSRQLAGMSVAQQGFSKLWGADSYDLLQCRSILPAEKVETPRIKLQQEFLDAVNCSPDIFRCTLTKIPETNSLLQKSRLPLGILIHPFKDLNHLAVIQCQSIVRCRACRTYINPFVYFVDHKRWKCNLCFRVNELPEEFQFDPVSKTYGDPSRRPEIKSSTIEFIAPSEYMLRPPQPAVYLFLLDVSCLAVESGYLALFCVILLDELDKLPGDGRTQVGFITYDSAVHFYSLAEGLNQPQQMVVVDVEDIFLPCPDSLVVNLNESKELARDLLKDLPRRFSESHDSHSALGPALQAAYKLMSNTGGRVTVFQSCLPNCGPGALASREVPSARAAKDVQHLNPATDFYKRLALDCSGQQIAVDLFVVNQQYCDLATLSGISQFSGGSIHHFPLFKANDWKKADAFEQTFRRYLTRKLGLEAVMRIRCSRGLAIHTFHGNFFVRSTDLLSLPNVNPDAGFGMQVSVEESLADLQNICFQAALLYTSSKGERRIRVHTLCLPVAANLSDVLLSADQQCIVGLLAKMAVDRSHLSSVGDAREAFINVAVDAASAYRVAQGGAGSGALLAPHALRLLPMYILALLKYVAFRTGQSTRLDDRVFAMCQMKTLPLANLIQAIYPDMYPVHRIVEQPTMDVDGTIVPQPPRLQLTAEKLESSGAFLLDSNDELILFVGRNVSPAFCQAAFGVASFLEIREDLRDLPEIDSEESEALRNFVTYLQGEKSSPATLQIIRDDSQDRVRFYERLVEDRSEASLSYYEFLQHIKTNVK